MRELEAGIGEKPFESERIARREEHREEMRARAWLNERLIYIKLHERMRTKGERRIHAVYMLLASFAVILIIGALLYTVAQLPPSGSPDAPAVNTVAERYIEHGLEETGAVNIVAGMILDYRAFDTLGESNVLFLAICSVLLLLRVKLDRKGGVVEGPPGSGEDDLRYEPQDDMILQSVADVLVPFILLLGLYIVFNGHLSPGGGFSGGAVMGAGLILYVNAHGYAGTRRFMLFSYGMFRWVTFAALAFYAMSKCYSFFTGANHLKSIVGTGTAGSIFSAGLILPLNICVGLVVAFTMYGFYTLFRKGDF
ncbi:MAG: hypothetical protein J5859_04655 [Clostridia bacterium]|nr:hypothetical protein [Clostridia bacterium]